MRDKYEPATSKIHIPDHIKDMFKADKMGKRTATPRDLLKNHLSLIPNIRIPTLQRTLDGFFDELEAYGYKIVDVNEEAN